jgi:hypothetical protein
MKKLWLVLLSLGLVMAFSVSAFAVDVKISAEYFAAGLYLNKTELEDVDTNPSTAFFYQRLRVGTDFIVSPCLKLVTRFDAMERIWGGARSGDGVKPVDDDDDYSANSAGTREENENIAVDLVYIDYTAPIGQFKVGYQPEMVWGTKFADFANGNPTGQIQYIKNVGPFTIAAMYSKIVDNSWSAVSTGINATRTDRDLDSYKIGGIYNFKGGEAGALLLFARDATCRGRACDSYLSNIYIFDPYVKAKIGPVALQAEAQYWFGDYAKYEGYVTGAENVSVGALSVFLDASANFGMFNVGGSAAYLSGDDNSTTDKIEGGINTAGLDWNPCLIMFNTETLGYWVGSIRGNPFTYADDQMSNAWFLQGRVGVKPVPQWDVNLSLSHAWADKKAAGYGFSYIPAANATYGTEVDLTATYKITNNLSYMLGAGYLFTGDYFKGMDTSSINKVCDDYMLINKLTLSF